MKAVQQLWPRKSLIIAENSDFQNPNTQNTKKQKLVNSVEQNDATKNSAIIIGSETLNILYIKFGWAATYHTIRDLFMYASQT